MKPRGPVRAPVARAAEDWQEAGFGVYVHWPFCEAKCPYCDFNSHVAAGVEQDRWARALVSEIARVAAMVPGRRVDTVFFGGGTPSLMEPRTIGLVLEAIARVWTLAPDAEITLEANPRSVEAARFAGARAAGVNRVSVGIQALSGGDLRRLGRLHDVAEAREAFALARRVFPRASFDLIYARQDQGLADWDAELTTALGFGADHLSLYQLTIEPGTVFGARAARGLLRGLPDEDLAAAMFERTQELTEAAGMPAYEVSNHARPGEESRHNLLYWTGGDYAGVGPGAHGRLTRDGRRWATVAPAEPAAWLAAAEAGSAAGGDDACIALTPSETAAEYLIMGLRCWDGISRIRLEKMLGRPIAEDALTSVVEAGLLERAGNRLRVAPKARILANTAITATADALGL